MEAKFRRRGGNLDQHGELVAPPAGHQASRAGGLAAGDLDQEAVAGGRGALFGMLATCRDGHPFLNSDLFVLDEERRRIHLHTARRGLTRRVVETNPRVCFAVAAMGRMLPAGTALEFSVEYVRFPFRGGPRGSRRNPGHPTV